MELNHNDLVYKIAARVKECVNQTMPVLRIWADVVGPTPSAELANKYSSKGELIEEIICHEFLED